MKSALTRLQIDRLAGYTSIQTYSLSICVALLLGSCRLVLSLPGEEPQPLVESSPTTETPRATATPTAEWVDIIPTELPPPTDPVHDPIWVVLADRGGGLYLLDAASGETSILGRSTHDFPPTAAMDLQGLLGKDGWMALRGRLYHLQLYRLPDEEPAYELPLMHADLGSFNDGEYVAPIQQIYATLHPWARPIWSPSKVEIAYNAVFEGEWVQVQLFNVETGEGLQITKGDEHKIALSWSPDGDYLVYLPVSTFSEQGYSSSDIGVIDLEGGFELFRGFSLARHPVYVFGWISETEMLYAERLPSGGFTNLRMLDLRQREVNYLHTTGFIDLAFDPVSRTILINQGESGQLSIFKEEDDRFGRALTIPMEGKVGAVGWVGALESYAVEADAGTHMIDASGEIQTVFRGVKGLPILSPDAQRFAFGPSEFDYDGELKVYETNGALLYESEWTARDILWWPDSRGVIFSNRLREIAIADLEAREIVDLSYRQAWAMQAISAGAFSASDLVLLHKNSTETNPIESSPGPEVTPSPTAIPDTVLVPGAAIQIETLRMVDHSHGWALGLAAGDRFQRLLHTSNGGEHWLDVTPPKGAAPTEERMSMMMLGSIQKAVLYVRDAQTAWITYRSPSVGGNRVWRTGDAGRSWQASEKLALRQLGDLTGAWVSGYLPEALTFIDPSHGWLQVIVELPALARGADYVLLRTEDGGQSWDYVHDSASCGPGQMVFLDKFQGWMNEVCSNIDHSSFTRTVDGGEFWYPEPHLRIGVSPSETHPEESCHGVHQMEKVAGGGLKLIVHCGTEAYFNSSAAGADTNLLYVSDDGGLSWTDELVPIDGVPDRDFSSSFVNEHIGWLLDYGTGWLWQTPDRGQTWRQIKRVAWEGSLHFVDNLHGWAIASMEADDEAVERALVRTSDGGYTWEILRPTIR